MIRSNCSAFASWDNLLGSLSSAVNRSVLPLIVLGSLLVEEGCSWGKRLNNLPSYSRISTHEVNNNSRLEFELPHLGSQLTSEIFSESSWDGFTEVAKISRWLFPFTQKTYSQPCSRKTELLLLLISNRMLVSEMVFCAGIRHIMDD
ncbi:hypothetical protein AKJ16_DCAP21867 [Drosera capensis]